jgi:hypothetical protein
MEKVLRHLRYRTSTLLAHCPVSEFIWSSSLSLPRSGAICDTQQSITPTLIWSCTPSWTVISMRIKTKPVSNWELESATERFWWGRRLGKAWSVTHLSARRRLNGWQIHHTLLGLHLTTTEALKTRAFAQLAQARQLCRPPDLSVAHQRSDKLSPW